MGEVKKGCPPLSDAARARHEAAWAAELAKINKHRAKLGLGPWQDQIRQEDQ